MDHNHTTGSQIPIKARSTGADASAEPSMSSVIPIAAEADGSRCDLLPIICNVCKRSLPRMETISIRFTLYTFLCLIQCLKRMVAAAIVAIVSLFPSRRRSTVAWWRMCSRLSMWVLSQDLPMMRWAVVHHNSKDGIVPRVPRTIGAT